MPSRAASRRCSRRPSGARRADATRRNAPGTALAVRAHVARSGAARATGRSRDEMRERRESAAQAEAYDRPPRSETSVHARIKSIWRDQDANNLDLDRHGDDRPRAGHRPDHRESRWSSPTRSSTWSRRRRCSSCTSPTRCSTAMDAWNQEHARQDRADRARCKPSTLDEADVEAPGARVPARSTCRRTSRRCAATRSARTAASSRAGCRGSRRYFHYRNLDVSTLKELVRRWKPELKGFAKEGKHEALADILRVDRGAQVSTARTVMTI